MPREVTINPVGGSSSGGRSISGSELVVVTTSGYWAVRYQFPMLRTPLQIAEYRGLLARLAGRGGVLAAPFFDCRVSPGGVYAWSDRAGYLAAHPTLSTPHSDTSKHSDGTGYKSQVVSARLTAGFSAQATQCDLFVTSAHAIRAGQYFSVNRRAYIISEIITASGANYRVRFWPPAREAAGLAEVQFDRPICLMRLADDKQIGVSLDMLRWTAPTMDLVEAI